MTEAEARVPEEWLRGLSDLFALYELLKADTDRCFLDLKEHFESQAHRRFMIRALFALVEGMSSGAFQLVLAMEPHRDVPTRLTARTSLSLAHISMLRDESYDLDEQGTPVVRSSKVDLVRRMLFAQRELAKRLNRQPPIDNSTVEWQKFRFLIKARDRLMHPKSATDLFVSDSEVMDANEVYVWLHGCYGSLLSHSEKS